MFSATLYVESNQVETSLTSEEVIFYVIHEPAIKPDKEVVPRTMRGRM